MSTFDLSKLPDLLARLDDGARVEPDPNTDIGGLRECCSEAAAAIRALMADRATEPDTPEKPRENITGNITAAVAAEREACAKVCEESFANNRWNVMTQRFEPDSVAVSCAAAIRARGAA